MSPENSSVSTTDLYSDLRTALILGQCRGTCPNPSAAVSTKYSVHSPAVIATLYRSLNKPPTSLIFPNAGSVLQFLVTHGPRLSNTESICPTICAAWAEDQASPFRYSSVVGARIGDRASDLTRRALLSRPVRPLCWAYSSQPWQVAPGVTAGGWLHIIGRADRTGKGPLRL